MKKFKTVCILFTSLLVLLQIGCTQYPIIQEPDTQRFYQTVYSDALRDSLDEGKLTSGMPYFVVDQIFKNWTDGIKETKIPVASLGSKQRLEESEGWGRKFVDPNIKVFLDKYETPEGELYVWYQRPDFYTMNISARDTLYLFFEDSIYYSVINYLNNSSVLTVRDSLSEIPGNTTMFAEIHYNEHQWRDVSYWYKIEILSNQKTFKLQNINYELYPIELLEFTNEPVSSFKWREINKNEN